MKEAKPIYREEFKQLQLLLNWDNETTASRLGVSLKTVVNWRSGNTRIPCYLREALSYFIHTEGVGI